MEWISFATGLLGAAFAYALFSSKNEEDFEDELESELLIHDFSGRRVTLSCQTCRKLKSHKEVEPNLFQCTKCKRHVDLRT